MGALVLVLCWIQRYEYFYGLLRDFPDLRFTINGGINAIEEVNAARKAGAHGVMVGRAAFNNPWNTLGHVDTAVNGAPSSGLTRRQPGNTLWKRKADAAFMHCKTMKSFFEETLVAIPDFVLDAPVGAPPPGKDLFANIHTLMPSPYESEEQELQYA